MTEAIEKSRLEPQEQFLVECLDLATSENIHELTFDEIVGLTGEFSPTDIIQLFLPRNDRIADVIFQTTGLNRKLALNIKTATAIDNLTAALQDPEVTTPAKLYAAITSADLVAHQQARRIWKVLFKHNWPNRIPEGDREMARWQLFMRELLEGALKHDLLTPFEYVKAIGFDQLTSNSIPEKIRACVVELAVTNGEGGTPYTAQSLIGIMTPEILVQNLDLSVLERVLKAVARKFGWIAAEPVEAKDKPATPPPVDSTKPADESEDVVTLTVDDEVSEAEASSSKESKDTVFPLPESKPGETREGSNATGKVPGREGSGPAIRVSGRDGSSPGIRVGALLPSGKTPTPITPAKK